MAITHVANGSHHDIFVVGCVRRINQMRCAYERIEPGCVHAFPACSANLFFLSMFLIDGSDGRTETICDTYGVSSDRSVVVDKDNRVHIVRYGELWKDEDGNDYWRPTN